MSDLYKFTLALLFLLVGAVLFFGGIQIGRLDMESTLRTLARQIAYETGRYIDKRDAKLVAYQPSGKRRKQREENN
jgi:hypothetical protein